MSLQQTINAIVNDKRSKKIEQIQQRFDEMSEQWFHKQWQKTFEIMDYYYKKSDEYARQKVAALEMEKLSDIWYGYKNILEQSKSDSDFDVFVALKELKKNIAEYDKEKQKWQKQFHTYEGSEKYHLRG